MAAFNALAASSEDLGAKIEKADKKFSGEYVDKFIDKQKLAQAAMTAARGETGAAAASASAYQREIERLIKGGLSPESEQIKKLQSHYNALTAETGAAGESAKGFGDGINAGLANLSNLANVAGAVKQAIGALASGIGKFLSYAAKVEDMKAAFEPMMGSAEKAAAMVKRINKEAVTTPFEIDAISASVKRLMPAFQGSGDAAAEAFRMLGDTAGGSAQKLDTITNAYTKALLKGKVGMEELNMISDAGVPIMTELAASMGISVQKLTEMSSKGKISSDDLTNAFKKMTGEGGLFYQGMEKSAFTYNSLMLGLQENMGLAAAAIGEKLLPQAKAIATAAGDAVAAFVEWVSTGDNLESLMDGLGVAIAAAGAALAVSVLIKKRKGRGERKEFPLKLCVLGGLCVSPCRFPCSSYFVDQRLGVGSGGSGGVSDTSGVKSGSSGVKSGSSGVKSGSSGVKSGSSGVKSGSSGARSGSSGARSGSSGVRSGSSGVRSGTSRPGFIIGGLSWIPLPATMAKNTAETKNLLEAYSGLDKEKKLDAETTKKLLELYPALTGRIQENAATVAEAEAAIKALNAQQMVDAESKNILIFQP